MKRSLCLLLFVLLAGCRGGGDQVTPGELKGAPIVVISIDTLRSDRLPAYGYDKVETPAIDALRADSILFERAYSHTPLTLPAHVSMLTGLLPSRHGIRDNVGYRFYSDKVPFLPRALKKAGYRTGAAVSAFVLRAETGLSEGFDFYEADIDVRPTESLGSSQRRGGETLRVAREWLEKSASGPFFFLFHIYEPHTPYTPPEPFASRYADRYDGEIAAADAIVGDLIAELERLGVYDKAIVVLLSDHGEGLGDHGEQEHGVLLYREAIQVPLMVKLPGGRRGGTSVEAPAQHVDLYPTLASLVGAEMPAGGQGTSLLDLEAENAKPRRIYAETWYPRLHMGWSELTSLVEDRFHYIEGPDPELYDLAADPAEKQNRLREERRAFATLRQGIKAFQAPLAAPSEVDAETAAQLAALGYLGSPSAATEGPLPDPKSRIHTLAEFGQAIHFVSRQEFAKALPLLEGVVAANPRMVDGWENLGLTLHRLGRFEEARRAYEEAMEISGGVGHVALSLGSLLLDMNRLDEAEKHAELGLETGPALAHSLLSRVALARGDTARAEKEARAALAARGSRIGPLIAMAQVLKEQDKLEEALKLTDEAERDLSRMEGEQRFTGLFLLRGDLLARLGRGEEAEQAFLREIRDFPGSPTGYSRLAVLYAASGRPQDAVATIRRMVEYEESPGAYAEAVRTLRTLGDPAGAAALLRHALAVHPQSKELRSLAAG
jgi:choline-sulfatase